MKDYPQILLSIKTSNELAELWKAYAKKNAYTGEVDWVDAYEAVESIITAIH